jgi:hypothetical protein
MSSSLREFSSEVPLSPCSQAASRSAHFARLFHEGSGPRAGRRGHAHPQEAVRNRVPPDWRHCPLGPPQHGTAAAVELTGHSRNYFPMIARSLPHLLLTHAAARIMVARHCPCGGLLLVLVCLVWPAPTRPPVPATLSAVTETTGLPTDRLAQAAASVIHRGIMLSVPSGSSHTSCSPFLAAGRRTRTLRPK